MHRQNSGFIRVIAMILIIAALVPISAHAAEPEAVQPRASDYLDTYNAYVYPAGSNEIRVYFNVLGTSYMDELGALSILIYESTDNTNWSWVRTFKHNTTAGMLSYNDLYHSGYVTYNGVAGRYYKAYVCIWGGKDGQGDTRYFWTSAKLAT